jgi:hypothetical protein
LKNYCLALLTISFLSFPIALAHGISIPWAVYSIVPPQTPVLSEIRGKGWHYNLPFNLQNATSDQKVISCESQGVNISRPDSDGIISDGVAQFHRASKTSPVGSGTWAWMEKLSGITGTPINPIAAIKMLDWAISHNLLDQWSCAKITGLLK